jgi:hypothetical protein
LDRLNRLADVDLEALRAPRLAGGGPVGMAARPSTVINNNTNNFNRLLEEAGKNIKVDVGLTADVDKDKIVNIVLKDRKFSQQVQKSNYKEAKSLARTIGG